MAPSVRVSKTRAGKSKTTPKGQSKKFTQSEQQQPTLIKFGRVTKVAPSPQGKSKFNLTDANPKQVAALAKIIQKQTLSSNQPQQQCEERESEVGEAKVVETETAGPAKRKREDFETSGDEVEPIRAFHSNIKKARIILPTTPPRSTTSSRPGSSGSGTSSRPLHSSPTSQIQALTISTPPGSSSQSFPSPLNRLLDLHSTLLKALSIHFAHNGPATPAELDSTLTTMTCLWKRHRVAKKDLQRVLAVYEVAADSACLETCRMKGEVEQKASPFKLITSGLRTCIEYVGSGVAEGLMRSPFNEKCLQTLYNAEMSTLWLRCRAQSASKQPSTFSFLQGPLSGFPLLSCSIGTQTIMRQERASVRRAEILDLSAKAQLRSAGPIAASIQSTSQEAFTPEMITSQLKSRTQSLFDRVKAKQLAHQLTSTATPESLLRRHALGRIAEVVDILRMKQQQKSSVGFMSSVHDSPSKVKAARVCFSMGQLVRDIGDSVAVPLGEDVVKMCLRLLDEASTAELAGWVRIFAIGESITSVVLSGWGMGGSEVAKLLEQRGESRT